MSRLAPILSLALLLGCESRIDDEQGKSCATAVDCRAPFACVQIRPGVRSCELLSPPLTGEVPEANVDAGQPYYCSDVGAVLTAYCTGSCHGADRSESNKPFRLDYYAPPDAGDLPGALQLAAKVKVRAFDNRDMPPIGAPQPSDLDRRLLRNWVLAGAPECHDGGAP